jgi:hypothetical protein
MKKLAILSAKAAWVWTNSMCDYIGLFFAAVVIGVSIILAACRRQTTFVDVINSLRDRLALSWLVLCAAYICTRYDRQPEECWILRLSSCLLAAVSSPFGYLGLCSVISVASELVGERTNTWVQGRPYPDEVMRSFVSAIFSVNITLPMVAFYSCGLRLDDVAIQDGVPAFLIDVFTFYTGLRIVALFQDDVSDKPSPERQIRELVLITVMQSIVVDFGLLPGFNIHERSVPVLLAYCYRLGYALHHLLRIVGMSTMWIWYGQGNVKLLGVVS